MDARTLWWLNALKSSRAQLSEQFGARLEPKAELIPDLARHVSHAAPEVDVLDVYGGALTELGNRLPRRNVVITQLEPEADLLRKALCTAQVQTRGKLVSGAPRNVKDLWAAPAFDLIVCRQGVLLDDPCKDLHALFSVLRPGGSLVVSFKLGTRLPNSDWFIQIGSQGLSICLEHEVRALDTIFEGMNAELSWHATSGKPSEANGWVTLTVKRTAESDARIRRELADFNTTNATISALYGVKLDEPDYCFITDYFAQKPDGTAGSILPNDAAFLLAWMKMVQPSRMLEIGVSSGVSSAFILRAAEWLGLQNKEFRLDAIDLLDHVYAVPDDPIGWAVQRLPETLKSRYNLKTSATTKDLKSLISAGTIGLPDIVFLDAEHAHPFPAEDLEFLCRVLPKGRWILLHDISLFERALRDSYQKNIRPDWMLRGVEWAYEHYPGEKFRGTGELSNVGAIRTLPNIEQALSWKTLRAYPNEKKLTSE